MKISNVSIRRSVTTMIVTAAIIIFGLISLRGMGVNLFPEVDIPVVSVTTALPGASPEVIDQDVTDVIEEQINTISGIRSIKSQSFSGFSQITVQFELSKDVDVAAQEVRAKVNLSKQNLPDDVEDPIVNKVDINAQPILWVTVAGNVDYQKLVEYADKTVKEQLQSVSGVGRIQLGGLRERTIRVWLDPEALEAHNMTATEVTRAIQSKHLQLPGGRIEQANKEFTVKVQGEFPTVDKLRQMVVKEWKGGVVHLNDVAKVVDGLADYRTVAHFNGQPTVGLGVAKQSGTNTVAVANAIKERVSQIKELSPENINIDIATDNSRFIKRSVEGVQFDLIFGVLMTALIMFIFLRNIRATFISVISIPVSLIGGFIVMYALDFTINNLTMLAMSLAVGLVIDDTIVVLENIFRNVEEGKDKVKAAREGTDEVGLAVIAAASSIIAVFLPVAFMKGIIGRFFFQFGLTVALTVLISALVSLTLTPFLCSRLLRRETQHNKFYQVLENFFTKLEWGYRKLLQWAVRHRGLVLLIAFVAFVAGMAIGPFLGTEFTTEADESRFMIRYELPTGTSIEKTNRQLYKMEDILFSYPEVDRAFSAVGTGGSGAVNEGIFFVNLVKPDQREASQFDVMDRVREQFGEHFKNTRITVSPVSNAGGGGRSADVMYVIMGPSVQQVAEVSDRVTKRLRDRGVFESVDTDLRLNKPQIDVNINRGLANDLGVTVRSISSEIYALFGGRDVSKFKDQGYRYDIRVRAQPQYRDKPEDLEHISVRNQSGDLINTSNLVDLDIGQGPNVINRFNRMRSVTIYANVSDQISSGEGLDIVRNVVQQEIPKNGIWRTALTGETRMFQESFGYLLTALVIAILVIYMVLAIQFESFIHPLTIMVALPLTMIGVFGALLITGMTLNIFSFIGIIMLMGLVTKNSILLVDFANQQRAKGVDKINAMIQAGQMRLRPILMTAVSTITGVLPVALALSEGGATRAPMAVAVIGGMFTSTVLTLLVIPVVYLLFENAIEWVREKLNMEPRTFETSTQNA